MLDLYELEPSLDDLVYAGSEPELEAEPFPGFSLTLYNPELDARVRAALELDAAATPDFFLFDVLSDLGLFNGWGLDTRALSPETAQMLAERFDD